MLNQGRNITHPNHKVHANSRNALNEGLKNAHKARGVRILLLLIEEKKPYSRKMIGAALGIEQNLITYPIYLMIEKGLLHVTTGRCEISGNRVELLESMEQKKESLQKQLL